MTERPAYLDPGVIAIAHQFSIPERYIIMENLVDIPKGLSFQELSSILTQARGSQKAVSLSTVSNHVKQLARVDLVESSGQYGRRAGRVRVTDLGRGAFKSVQEFIHLLEASHREYDEERITRFLDSLPQDRLQFVIEQAQQRLQTTEP